MMQKMKLASAEPESGNGWILLFSLQKATLVSAVDVYEEEESELLISFNRESF